VPSAYLRDVALGWGLDPVTVTVLPNPAPVLPPLPSRVELRRALGLDEEVAFGFAGRLTAQKALGDLLEALAALPRGRLLLLGDGPERGALERRAQELGLSDRVDFLGGGSREDVLRLFAAVDAAVLSSAWENFPHTVVEALAVGTPVVATAVGGVPEIVEDGVNGLLVPPRAPAALAAALRRIVEDQGLRERLAAAAARSVEPLAEEGLLTVVETTLTEVAR
jgi:glycosyltransferase involved in cell wall biosynthesis